MPEFLDEKEKKMLELESRRGIYNIVREFAGCHFREIERRSGLSTGLVKHHLDYMSRKGLIACEKDGNNLRYFPKEFNSGNKKLMGVLRQKSLMRIILFIITHEGCSHEQIAAHVKLSPSTASWHLKKLEEEGMIAPVKGGRKTFYEVSANKEEIAKLLITYRKSFFDALVDRAIEMWEFG